MTILFQSLLDDALSEVQRRDPEYLSRFAQTLPSPESQVERYTRNPLFQNYSERELAQALEIGAAYFADRGIAVNGAGLADPVAEILYDSVIDAFAADRNDLALGTSQQTELPLEDILAEQYVERRAGKGGRYFVRRMGTAPLLLINASGIPLRIWSRFLGDPDHDFKIVIVEGARGDILSGGVSAHSDLATDAADIVAALDAESIERVDILAWCDGGRLALDLAKRHRDRIGSLALVGVSLRSPINTAFPPTPFESSFSRVVEALEERPDLAPFLAKMFAGQILSMDWDAVAGDPEARASTLFKLPAGIYAMSVRMPVSQGVFLLNQARRARLDVSYPVEEALEGLDLPLLLITGDHDHIANNALAIQTLGAHVSNGIRAEIKGAGHYLYDLQYGYFRLLLVEFLLKKHRPSASARVVVDDL